jgi:hypothetical protein
MKEEHKGAIEVSIIFHEGQRMFAVPKQPAPVPLTDEAIERALKAACMHSTPESRKDMRRAIEAAHGITKGGAA